MSSRGISIRPFAGGDAAACVALLAAASAAYVRFFRPFEFETGVVERLVGAAEQDRWFALEILRDDSPAMLAGFYMLRGVDEGFADPMYGVFVAEKFSGCGLARLTLAHAEALCRLNGWPNLLLKVDPANARAFALYEASGFRFLRLDPATGNQVLIKPLSTPTSRPILPS